MKQVLTNILLILVLVGSLLSFSGCTQAPINENSTKTDLSATPEAPDNSSIKVSFKLDTGITKGTYMGERWVSPPIYDIVQTGETFTVEVRAQGIDAQGNEVKIIVKRAGESSLQVTSKEVAKTLSIKAAYQDNAIRVVVSQ